MMLVEVAPRAGGETDDFVCIGDTNSYPFVCCVRLWDITAGSPGRRLESRLMKCLPRPAPRPLLRYQCSSTWHQHSPDVIYAALALVVAPSLQLPPAYTMGTVTVSGLVNAHFSTTSVEASTSKVVGSLHHLEGSAVNYQEQILAQEQEKEQEIPEVQVIERIQEQIVPERIEEQIGDFPVPPTVEETVEVQILERTWEQIGPEQIEEQLIAEETTQNPVEIPITSSTSTTSDRRLDEFTNMLDSCIALLTPITAQIENIEKKLKGLRCAPSGC